MFAELTDMGSWKLLNKSLYNIFRNFHAEEKRNCNFWKGKGLSFFVDNWASIIITVIRLADWLVVGFNSNCLLVGPGAIGGIPSLGVFLRDPSRIYANLRENHEKLRTVKSPSATKNRIQHLPSTSFERKTVPPLLWQQL